jgi:CarboxypepD_reg-like domain
MQSKKNMRNKIQWLILTLSVLCNIKLTAQILRGSIQDSLNQPLPFVNIYIQESDDATIVAFSASNTEGVFEITLEKPMKRFLLKAALLGYETKIISVENSDNPLPKFDFKLNPKSFSLKEVVISGSNKIIQKSDTITFNADKFRDSTERNLEELLAKIPGVDVSKDGVISVQGKPIKKILIEGDDLTGRNYQMMSKNMTAYVVDKIQIIDKFSENKLLKGIEKSDDKVINITIKDKHKNIVFGNAVIGAGNDSRFNNSVNLMTIRKKFKSINFANYNSMGQISTADRMMSDGFLDENEQKRHASIVNSDNPRMIAIERTPSININSQNNRFNQAALFSSHFITRPNDKSILKGWLTLSRDRVQTYVNNSLKYRLGDSLFQLNESNELTQKPQAVEANIDFQIDLNAKSSLKYISIFKKTDLTSLASTVANENKIANNLMDKATFWANTIDFTHRINENRAFTANFTFYNNQQNQTFSFSQTELRRLPTATEPFMSIQQSVEKPMNYGALTTQYFITKGTQRMTVNSGVVIREDNLLAFLSAKSMQDTPLIISPDYLQSAQFRQSNGYIGLNWKQNVKGIQLLTDFSGGYFQTQLSSKSNADNGFYALPTIGFKKEKNKQTLFGTYSFNYALPQFADVFTGAILTDYRTIERGSRVFIPSNSHTVIGNYTYGNFSDEFLAYLNVIYSNNKGGYRSDFNVNNDFNSNEKIENKLSNNSLTLSSSVERYFSKAYFRLKIRPSISVLNYQNTLNGSDIRETQVRNGSLDISIRTAFLKWFNVHVGSTLTLSDVKTTTEILRGSPLKAVENSSVGAFCDVYLKIGNRCTARLDNEIFQFKQLNNAPQRYYFLNASVYYDIKPTKCSLSLYARNLLNTNEFINSSVTDYSENINRVRLLPRYVMLEINFRF